jgi:cell division protein FtsZ
MILFDEEVEEMKSVEKKVEKKDEIERYELVYSHSSEVKPQPSTLSANPVSPTSENKPGQPASKEKKEPAPKKDNLFPDINHSPATAVSGGYLAKPSNIYAEQGPEQKPVQSPPVPVNDIIDRPAQLSVQLEEEPSFDMHLVMKDEPSIAADEVKDEQTHIENTTPSIEDLPMVDEIEEQKRRASERVQKLRNLSFNINGADSNNEFETVPAYIRRNLELYNTVNNVENFYSNITVKADDKNKAQISTINTFLDGKKPD